jgi:hypothetical protein
MYMDLPPREDVAGESGNGRVPYRRMYSYISTETLRPSLMGCMTERCRRRHCWRWSLSRMYKVHGLQNHSPHGLIKTHLRFQPSRLHVVAVVVGCCCYCSAQARGLFRLTHILSRDLNEHPSHVLCCVPPCSASAPILHSPHLSPRLAYCCPREIGVPVLHTMPSIFMADGPLRLVVGLWYLSTYATLAAASTWSTAGFGGNTTTISWGSCHRNLTVPLLCGTLAVPLDYSATGGDSASLTLNLVKLPSLRQPSRGSILINPGGPGQGGRNYMITSGTTIRK